MMERAGNFADMVTGKKGHETTGKAGTGRKNSRSQKNTNHFYQGG